MSETGDEHLYAKVAEELESGEMDQGLWTKALAHNEFDEAKAKADYVETRVAQMKLEIADRGDEEERERIGEIAPEPVDEQAQAEHVKEAAREVVENYRRTVHKRGDLKYILAAVALIVIVFFWSNC